MGKQGSTKFYHLFDNLVKKINWLLKMIIILLLIIMTVTVLLQVFFRFVIKNSLPWSEELARYIMIWLVMLSAGLAFDQNSHIGVDFIVDYITNPGFKKVVKVFSYFLIGLFCVFIISWGYRLADSVSVQKSPAMRISMFWPYLSIPVGGIIFMVQTIKLSLSTLLGEEGGES